MPRCFENVNDCIEAPGTGVLGAVPGGGVTRASGTSYATAIVSGMAALLLSLQAKRGSSLDPHLVRQVLVASARPRSALACRRFLNPRGARRLLEQQMGFGLRGANYPTGTSHLLRDVLDRVERDVLDRVDYSVTQSALERKFKGVNASDFGTVTIRLPHGYAYKVPDFHYLLPGGRYGMRLIPASDGERLSLPGGGSVGGSDLLDAYLRCEMGLADSEPVYAILSYIHPEDHFYDAVALPRTAKVQLGHVHVGAYLGRGRTTHALSRYETFRGEGPANMSLNVDSHPANIQIVSLRGVSQATLNRNAHIVDIIVTAGAKIPENADDLTDCRTVELNTTLQYYRDMIRDAEYLEELSWFTQCTVHKAIVVNVFLNVPHNESAFEEIFGPEGGQLWIDFRRRYEAVNGEPFTKDMETAFTPLWKLAALPADVVRPLSLREYYAYHSAREEGRPGKYVGRRPLANNTGLAWPLETLVDLLAGFIETYAPFDVVGGVVVSAEVLLLSSTLRSRLGIPTSAYFDAVTPIVGKVLAAEASTKGNFAAPWLESAGRELFWLTQSDRPRSPADDSRLREVIQTCVAAANREIAMLPLDGAMRRGPAAARLMDAVRPELERLRTLVAEPGGRSGYFAAPAIFHRLALGLYPKSPFVEIRTVGTVVDHRDVRMRSSDDAGHDPPEAPVPGNPMSIRSATELEETMDHHDAMKGADPERDAQDDAIRAVDPEFRGHDDAMRAAEFRDQDDALAADPQFRDPDDAIRAVDQDFQAPGTAGVKPRETLERAPSVTPAPGRQGPVGQPPMAPNRGGPWSVGQAPLAVPRPNRTARLAPPDDRVYALGQIGYDFPSRSRRASLKQRMEASANPDEPASLLSHLEAHPHDAAAVQWTLTLQGTPIYVLEPAGPFATDTYGLLRSFVREQLEEGVERVSIPGIISGTAWHRSGVHVPVVEPALAGMYSWTTAALVSSVIEASRKEKGEKRAPSKEEELKAAVANFLERVYYELRNLGREPHERALNFAATNAFQVEQVYERAIVESAELDVIEVEPSTVCPPGANCWDVKLVFFFPDRPTQSVRKVYRFTVDVADIIPATVGPMRSWSIR